MTIQELFVAANDALLKSISHIQAEQWELPFPAKFAYRPANLRDTVRYHIYDDAWVPDTLAGKAIEEVGNQYEALLNSENVLEDYQRYNQRATTAVESFSELTRPVQLTYGQYPARDYIQHITSFRAFRSYDIAKLIGADTTMDESFVRALWDEYSPVIEGFRQMGVFPPALPVSSEANLQTKLMALVGRD